MDLETAKNLKNGQILYHKEWKNADGTPQRFSVTSIKTWKRSPERVEVRVKRGLYEYSAFSQHTINDISTEIE